MRSLLLPILVSATIFVAPARAEPPLPTTDFSGTWVVQDRGGNQFRADMQYSAEEKAMRMSMSAGGQQMDMIRDMDTGEVVMWSAQMPGMGMRMETPTGQDVDARPTGDMREVNGETCEVWEVEGGTACIGEDNIPLTTEAVSATAELQDLQRTPQDAALFEPPADLNIMDMPGAAQGGMQMPDLPF